jgi:hypothetical protein
METPEARASSMSKADERRFNALRSGAAKRGFAEKVASRTEGADGVVGKENTGRKVEWVERPFTGRGFVAGASKR